MPKIGKESEEGRKSFSLGHGMFPWQWSLLLMSTSKLKIIHCYYDTRSVLVTAWAAEREKACSSR